MAPCLAVAAAVAIRIGIFGIDYVTGLLGEVRRIPCLVQNRFPQPYAGMVSVAAHKIADVAVDTLGKFRRIVPELPSGRIVNNKQAQFIAGVHECRILRAMGIADNLYAGFFQFFCITPVYAVGHGIAYHREILMAVGADQRFAVGLAVKPESVFGLELNAADADAPAIAVYRITVAVQHPYLQVI